MNASDSTHCSSSQAVSSGFQTLDPGLKHDLKKHQNCEVDRLLSALLQRCRNTAPPGPTPSTPEDEDEDEDEDLLQRCLGAVLPICNSTDMRELLNV
jgi:hypothetical protein